MADKFFCCPEKMRHRINYCVIKEVKTEFNYDFVKNLNTTCCVLWYTCCNCSVVDMNTSYLTFHLQELIFSNSPIFSIAFFFSNKMPLPDHRSSPSNIVLKIWVDNLVSCIAWIFYFLSMFFYIYIYINCFIFILQNFQQQFMNICKFKYLNIKQFLFSGIITCLRKNM